MWLAIDSTSRVGYVVLAVLLFKKKYWKAVKNELLIGAFVTGWER